MNEGERERERKREGERKQPKEEKARMKEIVAKETKYDKVVTRLIETKYSCYRISITNYRSQASNYQLSTIDSKRVFLVFQNTRGHIQVRNQYAVTH